MEKIWIIGVGQFGFLALQKLSKSKKKRHFVLVDPNEENLSRIGVPNTTLEHADGALFLSRHLDLQNKPDWIIPALPIHLAAEWCLLRLGADRLIRYDLPAEIEPHLRNPLRGATGDIYVSHADFICPDDCAEPRDICTVTRKARERNMFELLEDIKAPPFRSLVVRSYQLGAGIGGYRPEQLFDLLSQIEQGTDKLLVSTACRCHGVVTGIKRL